MSEKPRPYRTYKPIHDEAFFQSYYERKADKAGRAILGSSVESENSSLVGFDLILKARFEAMDAIAAEIEVSGNDQSEEMVK
jgi:hypothetical protein